MRKNASLHEQHRRLVRVDRGVAFRINAVGVQRDPFPLSFSVNTDRLYTITATAAPASELVDVLAENAQEFAAVLNVGTNSWLDEGYRQWPLGRIAREQSVDAAVHDIRWAASRYGSDDLLVMPWTEVPRFLDGWSSYDIEIFDAAGQPSLAQAEALALAVNSHDMKTPVLPLLPGARLYYSGHDDCYIYIETTRPAVSRQVLARLLALQAGSALIDDPAECITVAEPPAELVADLLRRSDHWVAQVARCAHAKVTVAMAATDRPWRLTDPLPDVMPYELTLDLKGQSWSTSR